jgi:hypothetical protein
MVGIGEHLEKVTVPPQAPTIFWWTRSLSSDEPRILTLRISIEHPLQDDVMQPTIPKIVLI